MDFLRSLQRGHGFALKRGHTDLGQMELILNFWPPELWEKKRVSF